jgi:TM2 domain-containing membrane protein YozV
LLAGLLGFIPGVGAMYNGQFVKGIAHVIVFAVLTSLSHSSDIFGILVAAWVFYQVFDAYQTARARQLGLPLPNPFGLNDLGQKLGLQPLLGSAPSAYAAGGAYPGSAYPPTGNPPPPPGTPNVGSPGSGNPATGNPPAGPGAPAAGFVPSGGAPYGYTDVPFGATPPYAPAAGTTSASGAPPYYTDPAYTGYPATGHPDPRAARRCCSDRPIGAIILISLGTLFLFESLGILHGAWLARAWPLLIIGLGIWLFVRRSRNLPPAGVPPAGAIPGPIPGPVQGPGNGGPQ